MNTKITPTYGHPLSGFSLIETLITMTLFLFILTGVYIMVLHYGDVTQTENARMRLNQESRFLMSAFASEFKEAGAVLTLSSAGGFLKGEAYFNGIFPLNMSNFPDGIILAVGDPNTLTNLTQDLAPGGTVLSVDNATVAGYDPGLPLYENEVLPWLPGDKGIVIANDGYLVFSVTAVDEAAKTITIRDTPVYYSGLLTTAADPEGKKMYMDVMGTPGNGVTYPGNKPSFAPVVRLSSFSIYLFRELLSTEPDRERNIRQLIRVTDTFGQGNVLADGVNVELSVISESIWDMQISYIAYADFSSADRTTPIDDTHHYFAGGATSIDLAGLLTDIRMLSLKQIDLTIVSLTEEMPGRGERTADETRVPAIGDQLPYPLPRGKFSHKIFSLSVEPRNYGIIPL